MQMMTATYVTVKSLTGRV